MRPKVYSFKPKGKGYTIYAVNTDHSRRGIVDSSSWRSGGTTSNFVSSVISNFIARGIFGLKK